MKNDQHKTIVRLIYSFYSFEKIFFSLTVDYDVIDHVTLGWSEECSPRKNKSRLWTLQDSVKRSLVPKFVRLLGKKTCQWIYLADCFYFLRYWVICVLQLFVFQVKTNILFIVCCGIINLEISLIFLIKPSSTWPKRVKTKILISWEPKEFLTL